MTIFKACDIRGVVGREWGAAEARRIGHALGGMIRARNESSICVGGDFRRSTPELKQALTDGLLAAGLDVFDVGQQPTPVVYFAARHLGCRSVAVVTASHNPARYNGIKFFVAGQPPGPALIQELAAGLDSLPHGPRGTRDERQVTAEYEAWAVRQSRELAGGAAGVQGLSVALDAMAGADTHLAPRVLAAAGHTVQSLTPEIDPDYTKCNPDPSHDENLRPLVDVVCSRPADVGIALDGDGDRVVFVDHTGRIARPEEIAAILIRHCFHRPTVVYDLKCASLVARVTAETGGVAIMQPSGHGFIKSAMLAARAELGVEVSGHHFFGILDGGDDGLFTALVVLGLLSQRRVRLADLIRPAEWPAITPDMRIPFAGDALAAVEAIADQCGGAVTRLDGVRASYEGGWGLARASITEPAITFRFEGRDRDHLRQIADQFLAGAGPLRNQVLERIHE